LHISGADSETIHFLEESREGVSVNSKFYQFKRALKNYDVIILDPLIAMFGADENNNAHARKFINLFTRWATKENKTIIFIHHGTKNSSQSRGASAFVDAVRLVYRVEHIKNEAGEVVEDESRFILLDKDNNGAKKYLGSAKVKRQIFPQKKRTIEIEYE
jgi:replicative DNA helicase